MKKIIIVFMFLTVGTTMIYGQIRNEHKRTNMNTQYFKNKNSYSANLNSSVHEVKSCFSKDSIIRDYGFDYTITNICDHTLYIYIKSLNSSFILKPKQKSSPIKCTNPPIVLEMTHDNKKFQQWKYGRNLQQNKKEGINGLPKDVEMEIILIEGVGWFLKFTNNGENTYEIWYEFYSEDSKKFIENVGVLGKGRYNNIELLPCGKEKKFRNLKISIIK